MTDLTKIIFLNLLRERNDIMNSYEVAKKYGKTLVMDVCNTLVFNIDEKIERMYKSYNNDLTK